MQFRECFGLALVMRERHDRNQVREGSLLTAVRLMSEQREGLERRQIADAEANALRPKTCATKDSIQKCC